MPTSLAGSPLKDTGDINPDYPCADPNPYSGSNPARQERAWGSDIVNLQICKVRFRCTLEWYKQRDDAIRGLDDVKAKELEQCNSLVAENKNATSN